ncbi:hypothetical protein Tco_0298488 [Tanacetum coccineum]
MLPVLAVDQMSVSFVHRTSVVSVLDPIETMLYLLHRYCTLPPEETCCSLPLKETSCFLLHEETNYSLPLEETSCFLPSEETSYSLPPEETSCFLPPEETSYSLVIVSGQPSSPQLFQWTIPTWSGFVLGILGGVSSDCLPQSIRRRPYLVNFTIIFSKVFKIIISFSSLQNRYRSCKIDIEDRIRI